MLMSLGVSDTCFSNLKERMPYEEGVTEQVTLLLSVRTPKNI